MILGALSLCGKFAVGPSADSADLSWLIRLARIDADLTPATFAAAFSRHVVFSSLYAAFPGPASGD